MVARHKLQHGCVYEKCPLRNLPVVDPIMNAPAAFDLASDPEPAEYGKISQHGLGMRKGWGSLSEDREAQVEAFLAEDDGTTDAELTDVDRESFKLATQVIFNDNFNPPMEGFDPSSPVQLVRTIDP